MTYDFDKLKSVFDKLSPSSAQIVADAVRSYKRIFVCGAGRSGLMMKAYAMRLAQMGLTVYAVGETVTPAIEENDLLIAASASGETKSVIFFAETAKKAGATVYSITSSGGSRLTDISDEVIYLLSPTKNDVDTTTVLGTLFEQSVLLFLDHVIASMDPDQNKMRAKHANLE